MYDVWILLSRTVIWSAVAPTSCLLSYIWSVYLSSMSMCVFSPPFSFSLCLSGLRSLILRQLELSEHHSHWCAWCLMISVEALWERQWLQHLWLSNNYICWASNIICIMDMTVLLHAWMIIFPSVTSVCVCVFLCAGCENEHCTVEFRRPEAKRAEMRWDGRHYHLLWAKWAWFYVTQPILCVRMLSQ